MTENISPTEEAQIRIAREGISAIDPKELDKLFAVLATMIRAEVPDATKKSPYNKFK